jgi:flagellar hook-associated protein 1
MPSFFDLNIAISALRAQQYAMSVTGHNIANANTDGYRRQEVSFESGNPMMGGFAMSGTGIPNLGTGVRVDTIRRAQTDFMDGQVRNQTQWLGMWGSRNEALQQIEPILSEPGESGLSNALDKFWNGWQELASSPDDMPARISLVETAVGLTDRVRGIYHDLRSLQTETDKTIASRAEDINTITHQIAQLNEQITRSVGGGYSPNDLMDQRDVLVEKLSKLAKIEVYGSSGADMIVSINGKAIVQGKLVCDLKTAESANGWTQIVWSDDDSPVVFPGGEMKALTDIRDSVLEDYIQQLDTIARTIVTQVNAIHSTGKTLDGQAAGNFFKDGCGASDMAVDTAIVASSAKVSASATGAPGDNGLANAIAGIKDEKLIDDRTIGSAYTEFVSSIASQTKEAETRASVHDTSLKQVKLQRDSVAGVSLDEEMANMVRFQQSYNAAARIFNVIDEMIDTVVNRMGTGGR